MHQAKEWVLILVPRHEITQAIFGKDCLEQLLLPGEVLLGLGFLACLFILDHVSTSNAEISDKRVIRPAKGADEMQLGHDAADFVKQIIIQPVADFGLAIEQPGNFCCRGNFHVPYEGRNAWRPLRGLG